MLRIALPVLALLVVVAVLVTWFDRAGDAPLVPPPLTATALAALDDAALERQVVTDLAHRVLGRAGRADAWTRFNQPARHVWALGIIQQWIGSYGLAHLRTTLPEQRDAPGLADAQAACAAMGMPAAAEVFAEVATAPANAVDKLQIRLEQALGRTAARASRIAYLRQHLTELATP